MKKVGLALSVVMALVLFSSIVFADCESDCDGPFQTCLNLCRQTTKEDSSEGSSCVNRCLHGLSGCQKRCASNGKSGQNNWDDMNGRLLAGNFTNLGGTAIPGIFSQAPEPQCVCAECGRHCGSGHAKSCSSYNGK